MSDIELAPGVTVALSRINSGNNPRRYFDKEKHDELVASLKLRGMLQPILLRPMEVSDDFILVAGGRRYRAAVEAFGPDAEVPVIVRDMTDQEALEAAIDENDMRDDASETEQADAAARVLAACQNDRAEAARRLGWSATKLDRRLALASLSEPVKVALDERRIKVGHAELLAAVPVDKQEKALDTILSAGLDVAKTRAALTSMAQSLAGACFDKSECTTCVFNSGTQRALFQTHVDEGHCTNPPCYQLKTEAHEKATAALTEIADPGKSVTAADREPPADEAPPAGDGDTPPATPDAAPPAGPAPKAAPAAKATVTAQSIAANNSETREMTWRVILARAVERNPDYARTVIVVAAMSGTLAQISAESLTSRAWLLVNEQFPRAAFRDRIDAVRDLPPTRMNEAFAAIAAAYAKHAADFGHIADLATAFDLDLRTSWRVDKDFLGRFSKDELKFIAVECGLVEHMGAAAFAKLLKHKPEAIADGMLNATGFDWAGHLPSAMTLDGTYGAPPPAEAAPEAVEPTETGEASTDTAETTTDCGEVSTDPLDAMRKEIRELADEPAVILAKDVYGDEPSAFLRDADGGWSDDEGDSGYASLTDLLDQCEIITGHWPTREAYEEFANPTPTPPATTESEDASC